jgi:hypothetical protein
MKLGKFVLPSYLADAYNKPISLGTGMQLKWNKLEEN